MEVVIKKNRGEIVIKKKLIRKESNYFLKNEIVKLQNEVVIFEIIFGMVHRWPYKGFQNIT